MGNKEVPVKLEKTDFTGILIAVLVIIVTLVFIALYRRRKSARRGILITGLCDSGKTVLFTRLIHNKFVNTHTSIKENFADYVMHNTLLRIIDIPGHERLRGKYFDQYKTSAKAIVYVVDSITLQKDVRDAAEYLWNVLTDSFVASNSVPVLILCNKQDLPTSKGKLYVQSIFEKEMNTLRITKSNQLQSVDPSAQKTIILGNSGEDFRFSDLDNTKVSFAECTAFNEEDGSSNIDELQKWLVKLT